MDFLFFDDIRKIPYLIPALIAINSMAFLLLNMYGLLFGITNVLPHLFYIPILLAAYYYPRRGVLFAAGLSACYCAASFTVVTPTTVEMLSAIARSGVFIVIAGVVSYLSGRMHHDTQMCRRLVSVVRSSSDAISGETPDGIVTDWNAGAEHLYGYTSAEMVGTSGFCLIPPEQHEEKRLLLEKIRQGEIVDRVETERITKDGRRIQVSLSLSPILNSVGEIIGVSDIAHDINERKNAEDALRESEEKYRTLFENMLEGFAYGQIIYDEKGFPIDWIYLDVNTAFERLTGLKNIKGRRVLDVIPTIREATPELFDSYGRVASTGTPDRFEIDFTPLHLWLRVSVFCPKKEFFVVVFEDITEHKRVEIALKESEEKLMVHDQFLQRLIETIPNPIFYKDKNGIYTGCNTAFEQYIGFSKEKLVGRSVYDISPKDLADIYNAQDWKLLDNPGTQIYESAVKYADSSTHNVIFNKATFTDLMGNIDGIVGIIIDITERKHAEDALALANRKLNLLSSITRHDINNQLTALNAYILLSEDAIDDPVVLKELIGKEQKIADSIARQIRFTKDYEGLGVKSAIWQDVGMLVRSAETALPIRNIRLDVRCPGLEVFADPLLEKVFYNLIDNSLHYGGEKMTTIRVTVSGGSEPLWIMYDDDGAGVSADDKKQLFTKGFGKHTGLGLFLSREILSITGISITETGEPGKGARFEIAVPEGVYRFAEDVRCPEGISRLG
jgi:PAS domain S-box-containing protein